MLQSIGNGRFELQGSPGVYLITIQRGYAYQEFLHPEVIIYHANQTSILLYAQPYAVWASCLIVNLNQFYTWTQEPNGYDFPVAINVPENGGVTPEGGFPVCILLHGNGGNGDQMANQFSNVLSCHILVAPTAIKTAGMLQEGSDAPDTDLVESLIDTLQCLPMSIRIKSAYWDLRMEEP